MEALAAGIAAFCLQKALYRTKSDCLAAIWFDAPPNGNGYISSSASSRCIF